MTESLLRVSSAAFKAAFAASLGCAPSSFDAPGLTIVQRPPGSLEPHLAIMAECGVGSVVSVRDPRLGGWAARQELEAHFRIFLPSFLEGMVAHARELGYSNVRSHSPGMGMVLASEMPPPSTPADLSLVEIDRGRQEDLRATGEFGNALGEPGEREKIDRFRTAFALFAPDGTVAGVTGIWELYPGIDEIGVDVASAYRGRGLAKILTLTATREIRGRGVWPVYTFGVSNLRSQNNGLACGFRPLWLITVVHEQGS